MSQELTYADVLSHAGKEDLFMVINENVYDVTSFVDEHPGGEEVLLDVGGQDATEAFEDVGHSDEAREILNRLKIGTLKRQESDPKPKSINKVTPVGSTSTSSGLEIGLFIVVFLGIAAAYAAYKYIESQGNL